MTETKPEVSNSKKLDADALAKQFAFLAILLYIIGFLTTNLYLQQFGFSDFSPINPRFIFTGGLVILFVLFNDIFCLIAILIIWNKFFKDISNKPQTSRRKPKLVSLFLFGLSVAVPLSVVSFIIVFGFFVKNYPNWEAKKIIFNSFNVYFFCLLVGLIPLFPWLLALFKGKKIKLNLTTNYLAILIILIYIQLCGIYLGQFAKYIYPKVPEQLGGGEPRKVRILFTKAQAETLQKNGMPTCKSGNVLSNWSKPVNLLFENSEKYLLRLEEQRPPIQLYKRNVDIVESTLQTYNQKETLNECPYTYTEKSSKK